MKPLWHAFSVVFLLIVTPPAAEASPWRTNGPEGGLVYTIEVAPTDSTRWYAGTARGLFWSADGGESWTRAAEIVAPVPYVSVDAEDPSVVYFGTEDQTYRSRDGGSTVQQLELPFHEFRISEVLAHPEDGGTVYVAGKCEAIFKQAVPQYHERAGIFRSTDGGETWQLLENSDRCVESLAFDSENSNIIYASLAFGFAKLTDDGQFLSFEPPLPGAAVVSDPADPTTLYGVADSSFFLLVSTDSGNTWTERPIDVIGEGHLLPRHITTLTVDSVAGRLFLGTTMGAFRSGDGGRTWLPLEAAGKDAVRDIALDPLTGAVTIATINGAFRSDGAPWNEWTELPISFVATSIRELERDPADADTLWARSQNRVFKSSDLGRSWDALGTPLPSRARSPFETLDIAVGAAGAIYVAGWDETDEILYRWDEEAGQWHDVSPPYWRSASLGLNLRFVTADPRLPGVVYAGQAFGVHRSRDGGESWEPLNTHSWGFPEALTVHPHDSKTLYMGSEGGIARSTDAGSNWTRLEWDNDGNRFSRIVIDELDGSRIFAFEEWGPELLRSIDAGTTWSRIEAPGEVTGVALDPDEPSAVYISTRQGSVYRSRDLGTTWEAIDAGLPDVRMRSIIIDGRGTYLHVGTEGRGVWERPTDLRRRPVRSR